MKFYFDIISPPARAVLCTLRHLNIPSEFVNVRLFKGENRSAEFLKINSQGLLPVIDDDGFILRDSNAINIYLCTKYAENDKLYPSDTIKRASIHERLFFNNGELFVPLKHVTRSVVLNHISRLDEVYVEKFRNGYQNLEDYLQNDRRHIAGDDLSIADFSVVATAISMDIYMPIKKEKFPSLVAYLERAKSWPYYAETNGTAVSTVLKFLERKNFTVHS